ncbi:hypothetical protein GCM10011289_30080 [Paludibacterium paludis]|uniref:Uncharacterized protein n=2 Tax=Paludibacterium paludis TaxID=1225769 RepID=A0A918P645_9NEIS|nr:hypothetical protein GCM10011289_30080 [Paludibacterium paludis]
MKKLATAILAGVFFIVQGCAMANDIVGDIKKIRESNKDANIDISGIVKKYILVGTHKAAVENYLKEHKFSLNDQPIAPDRLQTLVAVYVERNMLTSVVFHDEIRVIVVFENGVVKTAGGRLIYRAL